MRKKKILFTILGLVLTLLFLSSPFSYASNVHSFKATDKDGSIIEEKEISGIEFELEFDNNNNLYPVLLKLGLFKNDSLVKSITSPEVHTKNKINLGDSESYDLDETYEVKYKVSYTVLGNDDKQMKGDWKSTGKFFKLTENKDETAPTIVVESNISDWTSKDVELTIRVTEEEGGSGIKEITLPDGEKVSPEESAPLEFTTKYTVTKNETYIFKVEDIAGNTSEESIIISNIDKEAPTKPSLEKENNEIILIPGTDKDSGIDKHLYNLNDSGWLEWSKNIDISSFEANDYILKVKAIDKAGNESEAFEFSFTTEEDKEPEEDSGLEEATLAVEKAENTIKQTDVSSARTLVNKLNDGEDKDSLNARLDAVEIIIANIQEAALAVEVAEETITQEDVDSARALVNALPNGTDKTNLNKRLDAVQAKIDAEKEEDARLQEAIAAVEKAESTIEQADVNTAKNLVSKLKNSETKTQLNNRLDDVQALIDYAKLLREATEAVERAEATQNQSSVNLARTRVDRLPEGSDKAELHARLDIVQRNIDAMNRIGDGEVPEGDIEDYPPAIREEIENLQAATEAVEKAESTELQEDVDSARILVNKLNPGKGKNDLNARLNEVQKKIDYAKLLGEATLAVEKAEDTREKLDIRDGYSKVNRLSNGQDKTALLNRLKALENELIKEEKVQKGESDAIRAVEIAEIFKGREPRLSIAQEKVDALEEGALKDLLQERLDRLTGKNSSDNEFDDPKYIDSVEKLVKQAEMYKREPHIGNARSAVDKLSEGEVKDDFNRRLNALEGKSGSGSGFTFEQQVKSVERFVSQAEVYRTESRVEIARDKVNEMEDSIEKADFLDRLNALEGKSGSGSGLTFEQQVKSVERLVSQAEVYKTESRVEVARDKVNEMEDSIERADFLDRLDEIAVR